MSDKKWIVTVEITVYNARSNAEALATVDGSLRSMFAKYALCDVVEVPVESDLLPVYHYPPCNCPKCKMVRRIRRVAKELKEDC